MNFKIPELLSPAGSFDALKAAVHAGCDAVYLGGNQFGARANAENFNNEILPKAIDYAHLRNVKIYFTANTLIKEKEIDSFLEQIQFLYTEGIDAIILQDLGAYHIVKKYFPDFPLHASTQMTVHSLNGVKFLEDIGFERVVLSRELSLKEIEHIRMNTTIELECFVHGALCYCYSGQCLFSSILGGRSGNRGCCAQPCRLPYTLLDQTKAKCGPSSGFLLSPKDIQTLEDIPELIKGGIHSFKIEGRMKNANYVGLITSLYRKYIDAYLDNPKGYSIESQDLLDMHQIYNRGGFSSGYYFQQSTDQMMSMNRPNHQGIEIGNVAKLKGGGSVVLNLKYPVHQGDCLEIHGKGDYLYSFIMRESAKKGEYELKIKTQTHSIRKGDGVFRLTDVLLGKRIEKDILQSPRHLPLSMSFQAKIGLPAKIELSFKDYRILHSGSIVEEAKTHPMTEEKVKHQLNKPGDFPVYFENIELNLDSNIFLSIQEINMLRREAIEALLNEIKAKGKRQATPIQIERRKPFKDQHGEKKHILNVLLRNFHQFEMIKTYNINTVYLELLSFSNEDIQQIALECQMKGIDLFLALPKIIRDSKKHVIDHKLLKLSPFLFKGFLLRTIDGLSLCQKEQEIILDSSCYVFNNETIDFWRERGMNRFTTSVEMNLNEISKLQTNTMEAVIYGYTPLMVSAQCLKKNTDLCDQGNEILKLKDRKNKIFPVERECNTCINTIYNSAPTFLIDKYQDLEKIGIRAFRLEFLNETDHEIKEIMNYASNILEHKSMSAKDIDQFTTMKDFTRGHLYRGVK